MENVVELFLAQAKVRPDAIALIDRHAGRDRATTFAELEDRSARIATLLERRGIGAGAPVLLFHPPTAELYAVIIAIFRLGAIAMVVDVSAGRETLAAACRELPPAALFASGRALLLALASAPLRGIAVKATSARYALGATRLAGARGLPRYEGAAALSGGTPALVTFTSGSTGAAKGAVRTHAVLRAQHHALGSVAAATGERDLVSLPIVVLTNLGAGATSVIPEGDLRWPGGLAPAPVLGQVERNAVQRITASPALVERLVKGAREAGTGELRGVRIVTGGGPVFPDLVLRATELTGAPLVAAYGSTEAEPIAHVTSAEIGDPELAAMLGGAGLIAGHPAQAATVRIVPVATSDRVTLEAVLRGEKSVAAGTRGEIVVSGKHVVPGYLHGRGDAETKVRVDGVVWHRTGDAGYLDGSGRLWLLGRVAATIHDGRGELHPFAVECAARLVIPGRRTVLAGHRGQRMLLVEEELTPAERTALADGLRWAMLDRIIDRVRIPLDRRHNSKVDYAALPALLDKLTTTAA
ncbi:MAG TPA: AMP-binding protein [Gemmatimonadaceae bacterium]|nr:AMP-binding protein [Gemmatimonadaceae bacterium]